MRAKHLTLAVVVAVALAFTAPGAQSRPLRASGTAAVKSVDGPGQLTITVGRRALPVRLYSVDVPRPGECGAAETTAALSGFVRRAPRKIEYALASTKTGLQRDASGRFVAILAYRGSRGWRDFGADLLRTGWGRDGDTTTGAESPPVRASLPEDARGASGGGAEPAGRVGVWARCGGRVHLPL
ncbi:MAG: hypothetical protein Q7T55_01140, partial [Solirubrobacteraceae bacterium]|nr:hypothetical protein [Solirubrobacteraceae bacterium]